MELPGPPSCVTVLQDDAGTPAFVVTSYKNLFRLVVEPLESLAIPIEHLLRLWAVARESGFVRPMAMVTGSEPFRHPLSNEAWQLMEPAETLIVSPEPLNAQVTAPTGPVLYSGLCLNLRGPSGT